MVCRARVSSTSSVSRSAAVTPRSVAEADDGTALRLVDGRPTAEAAAPARPADEAGDDDVHAVLHRAGCVVEVAAVLAAVEVRRGAQVRHCPVVGGGAGVLGKAAVVADGEAELEALDPDRGAVVAGREVQLLVAVEVLLVVRGVDGAVGLDHDARDRLDSLRLQRAAGHDHRTGVAGSVAKRVQREVGQARGAAPRRRRSHSPSGTSPGGRRPGRATRPPRGPAPPPYGRWRPDLPVPPRPARPRG